MRRQDPFDRRRLRRPGLPRGRHRRRRGAQPLEAVFPQDRMRTTASRLLDGTRPPGGVRQNHLDVPETPLDHVDQPELFGVKHGQAQHDRTEHQRAPRNLQGR